jgi:threonine dehydratase
MAQYKTCLPLTPESIKDAHSIIRPHIHRTPVLTSATLDRMASTPSRPSAPAPRFRLLFKCENYQKIGAFKARGAFHAVKHLIKELGIEEVRRRGVVTHSSGMVYQAENSLILVLLTVADSFDLPGNHAQALALAASTFSIPGYIVMPTISTPSKIAGTRKYTDHIIFSGSTSQERESKVEEVIKQTGAILVPPYDHPDIILGQGTTALELQEQYEELVNNDAGGSSTAVNRGSTTDCGTSTGNWISSEQSKTNDDAVASRQLDAVIAPLGGGGLLSGIATYFSRSPGSQVKKTLVFGAEPSFQGGDDARRGLAAGKRIETVKTLTIADGLRTPVGVTNWGIISDKSKVEGVYAVTDEQIKAAMRLVLERMKVFVEPSACVGLAVVLYDEAFREMVAKKQQEEGGERAWDVGVVFSGGNTTVDAIAQLFGSSASPVVGRANEHEGERQEGTVGMNGEKVVESVAG